MQRCSSLSRVHHVVHQPPAVTCHTVHDSERAAIIYQHEARGADLAITAAMDAYIEAVTPTGDGSPGSPSRSPNGLLMARGGQDDASKADDRRGSG
jgi:hypothetical protein